MSAAFLHLRGAGGKNKQNRYGGYIQTVSTAAKLLPILAIIGVALLRPAGSTTAAGAGFSGAGFSAALIATLWAYDGWITIGNISGEMKKPRRDLPLAIIGGILLVAAVYIIVPGAPSGYGDGLAGRGEQLVDLQHVAHLSHSQLFL